MSEDEQEDFHPIFVAHRPARPNVEVFVNASDMIAVSVDNDLVCIDYEDAEWFAQMVRKAATALEKHMQNSGRGKNKDGRGAR